MRGILCRTPRAETVRRREHREDRRVLHGQIGLPCPYPEPAAPLPTPNLAAMTGPSVEDFDFDLPPALVAAHPCAPRDAARLLLIPAAGDFAHRRVVDLLALLRPGDLLVCNDTRVIPVRLFGRRDRLPVEVTLVRDEGGGLWRGYAKGARRLHPGDRLTFGAGFVAVLVEKYPTGALGLRFDLDTEAFRTALE